MSTIPADWLSLLACPRDAGRLTQQGASLCCEHGHRYPVVEGIPVLLVPEMPQTIGLAAASWHAAVSGEGAPLYLATVGLSEAEKASIQAGWAARPAIDPVISHLVGATSGYAYLDLVGRVAEYPIPPISLPAGAGRRVLDVGCSWGRWSVAAARSGWRAMGLDPSLGALLACRRAFGDQEGRLFLVCGDARKLPLADGVLDAVYSYSVVQHFSEEDAAAAFTEAGRVLRAGGFARIQMAQKWGLRSLYHWTRPGYLDAGVFRVRYWPLRALRGLGERTIGPCRVEAEAFGGLGLLEGDRRHLPWRSRLLVSASAVLKRLARIVPPLAWLADSVFVTATRGQGRVADSSARR